MGVTINGSFAEYEVVDGRECCLLPDNVSFKTAAPLACAGITVWGGLVRANLKASEAVAIVGGGGGALGTSRSSVRQSFWTSCYRDRRS